MQETFLRAARRPASVPREEGPGGAWFRVVAPAVFPEKGGDPGTEAKGRPRELQLLATSFSMTVGETLVVGTSKLDGGDEALVVLLTAAP